MGERAECAVACEAAASVGVLLDNEDWVVTSASASTVSGGVTDSATENGLGEKMSTTRRANEYMSVYHIALADGSERNSGGILSSSNIASRLGVVPWSSDKPKSNSRASTWPARKCTWIPIRRLRKDQNARRQSYQDVPWGQIQMNDVLCVNRSQGISNPAQQLALVLGILKPCRSLNTSIRPGDPVGQGVAAEVLHDDAEKRAIEVAEVGHNTGQARHVATSMCQTKQAGRPRT